MKIYTFQRDATVSVFVVEPKSTKSRIYGQGGAADRLHRDRFTSGYHQAMAANLLSQSWSGQS